MQSFGDKTDNGNWSSQTEWLNQRPIGRTPSASFVDSDTTYTEFITPAAKAREQIKSLLLARNALWIEATNDKGFVGYAGVHFKEWIDEQQQFLAGGLVFTCQRGFARKLLTSLTIKLEEYVVDNGVSILDRVNFITGAGRERLLNIYKALGYEPKKELGGADVERCYG